MARKATKALEDQGYSKLDAYCIGLHEYYKSLRKAGFNEDRALYMLSVVRFVSWMDLARPNRAREVWRLRGR